MATNYPLASPPQTSPRRALQPLSANTMHLTPQRVPSGKLASTTHAASLPTPASVAHAPRTNKENRIPYELQQSQLQLNPSKKRAIDSVLEAEPARDKTQLMSFSSLIDYDPRGRTDTSEAATSPPSESDFVKLRARTLKARLQLAMFRVQTNQVSTPFAQLELPASTASVKAAAAPDSQDTIPDTDVPSTPPSRGRSIHQDPLTDDEDSLELPIGAPVEPATHASRLAGERDVTSSAEKGVVASGLLDLRKSG